MPELIEVYFTASFLNWKLKNKNILSINAIKGKYLKGIPEIELLDFRKGIKVNMVRSKGKLMWFELSGDTFIKCHSGLGGRWKTSKTNNSNIEMNFDGFSIFFENIGVGKFEILNKDAMKSEIDKLSSDYIHNKINCDSFHNSIVKYSSSKSRQKHKIVKVLMDQNSKYGCSMIGLGSGLGNYMVAEILYKAKMSPHTLMEDIAGNVKKSDGLCNAIKHVVRNTYYNMKMKYVDDQEMLKFIEKKRKKDFEKGKIYPLTKIPKTFKFSVYGRNTDPNGNKVNNEKILGNRTTYWSVIQVI